MLSFGMSEEQKALEQMACVATQRHSVM